MREYTKIEVRCKDDSTQSWQAIAPYSWRMEVGDDIATILQDLACHHWGITGRFPIEIRWNYLGSLQGHYFTPTKPDPIVNIEFSIPTDRDAMHYRHVCRESQIDRSLEVYLQTHNKVCGMSVARFCWHYEGSMVYQIYPKE